MMVEEGGDVGIWGRSSPIDIEGLLLSFLSFFPIFAMTFVPSSAAESLKGEVGRLLLVGWSGGENPPKPSGCATAAGVECLL